MESLLSTAAAQVQRRSASAGKQEGSISKITATYNKQIMHLIVKKILNIIVNIIFAGKSGLSKSIPDVLPLSPSETVVNEPSHLDDPAWQGA